MRIRALQARFHACTSCHKPHTYSSRPHLLHPIQSRPFSIVIAPKMTSDNEYASWDTNALIARITDLEAKLRAQTSSLTSKRSPLPTEVPSTPALPRKSKLPKPFNPHKYTTRLIALKFAYLGANYQGFEHHVGNPTPLPTIEEELWKALVKCRLIFPPSLEKLGLMEGNVSEKIERMEREGLGVPVDWEGCEYSKCGRTDRGVSAFGQVVGLRVRSARLVREKKANGGMEDAAIEQVDAVKELDGVNGETMSSTLQEQEEDEVRFDPIKDELPYIALLNRVLPPTIRILAWCPSPPPNFSARFSCKERLYKYFFTNPAYLPFPSNDSNSTPSISSTSRLIEGYLDVEAMKAAANYLVGTHDFRNFCKVDATKQITNFKRRITHASIEQVSTSSAPATFAQISHQSTSSSLTFQPQATSYTFTIRGSAFLWHQVRCMVGVLFLVGQGLEKSEIVWELLNVEKNPRRPQYEMASDKPLVLWDCTFSASAQERYIDTNCTPTNGEDDNELDRGFWDRGLGDDELEWVYADGEDKWGRMGLMEDLWRGWRAAKIDELLAGQFFDLVNSQGADATDSMSQAEADRSARIFQGEDAAKPVGKYVPVMQKEKMETVEVINAKYLSRKDVQRNAGARGNGDDANE